MVKKENKKSRLRPLWTIMILTLASVVASDATDLWSRNAATNVTYPTNFLDLVNVTSFRINNQLVCLADGTNCPNINSTIIQIFQANSMWSNSSTEIFTASGYPKNINLSGSVKIYNTTNLKDVSLFNEQKLILYKADNSQSGNLWFSSANLIEINVTTRIAGDMIPNSGVRSLGTLSSQWSKSFIINATIGNMTAQNITSAYRSIDGTEGFTGTCTLGLITQEVFKNGLLVSCS